MSCCSEVCPFMATFDAAQFVNFEELSLNWIRIPSDTKEWRTLHYKASNGPVWPHLVNGDHVWSRIWSMNDLVHIEADVRILGLRYQVMAGKAIWGKTARIWPKVSSNGPMYVLVARYDKFCPYLCLHYQFWRISTLSGRFDHIVIKIPSKCRLARNS